MRAMLTTAIIAVTIFVLLLLAAATATTTRIRAGLLGDFGRAVVQPSQRARYATTGEKAVAEMIKSWAVDFIVTMGDNNYENGRWATIDDNIGQFYSTFMYPYNGNYSAGGAPDKINRFFPTIGNHDNRNLGAYLKYFKGVVPPPPPPNSDGGAAAAAAAAAADAGNERYYTFTRGPLQVFCLNSNEPDITETSPMALWVKAQLARSTAAFRIIVMHHEPWSADAWDRATPALRWPYRAWGVTAVVSGHSHTYQKFFVDGVYFLICGLGGTVPLYPFLPNAPVANQLSLFNDTWGALMLDADATTMNITFRAANHHYFDKTSFSAAAAMPASSSSPPPSPSSSKHDIGIGILIGIVISGVVSLVVWAVIKLQQRSQAAASSPAGRKKAFSVTPGVLEYPLAADDHGDSHLDDM